LEAEVEDRLLAAFAFYGCQTSRVQEGTGGSMSARSGVVRLSPWVGVVDHRLSVFVERQRRTRGGAKVIFFGH
jgi:hypothetical protein